MAEVDAVGFEVVRGLVAVDEGAQASPHDQGLRVLAGHELLRREGRGGVDALEALGLYFLARLERAVLGRIDVAEQDVLLPVDRAGRTSRISQATKLPICSRYSLDALSPLTQKVLLSDGGTITVRTVPNRLRMTMSASTTPVASAPTASKAAVAPAAGP